MKNILISVLLLWSVALIGQKEIPRLSQLDVEHYVFNLELSDEHDTIRGEASLRIRFLKELPELHLDLVGPAPNGKGMKVQEVLKNGRALNYRQEAPEDLFVELDEPLAGDSTHLFTIQYSGIPKDGLIIGENLYGQRTFFGDNWPNRAHHWLPCVDHPSDKATIDFIVTAPDHYQVVANGEQLEELNLDEATKLTHWREAVPIPMKVAVIGAAQFGVRQAGEVGGVPVSSWVYPGNRTKGYHDYAPAVEVLHFFTEAIGPYAYEKLANVQSKTRYGGMENAGNIFYFEQSVTGGQDHIDLIAHEVAHQWFGNSVTEGNWHHIWLSEGFATYGANLYIEHAYGRDEMAKRLISERQQVLVFSNRSPRPVIDTTVTDWNRLLNANSYQKGSWVLHMLRRKVGEVDFWKGLRQYYAAFKNGNALTADFQRVMEAASGMDLSRFFQQWLYQPGYPELAVEWSQEGGLLELDVRQLQPGPAFDFPLDIKAEGPDGAELKWTVDINRSKKAVSLPCNFEPKRIWLDPDTWLLFSATLQRQ